MLKTQNSGLATRDSGLSAIDVLFHPTSRSQSGACPLRPPTEAEMDAAGIACVLVSQCKKWSCDRQWMCVDTRLDEVLRYTEASPRFLGLAGYNPFDITESLREIEFAVATRNFRGAYMHAVSFSLPLADTRMYPLFAKAAELAVPVLVQAPPIPNLVADLERLTADFPELAIVIAQTRPELADLTAIVERCENVFFALDPGALAHVTDRWSALARERQDYPPELFLGFVQERCMWGSNGMTWADALRSPDCFTLLPELKSHFLRRNAERVFALDQPPASRTPRSIATEVLAAER